MNIAKLYPPKNNGFVINDLPIHSSSFFGALANCFVNLFGAESFPDFLSLFENGKISSIFPAIKIDDKEILFLPIPYISKLRNEKKDEKNISKKKIKNIRWVSFSAIKLLANSIEKTGDDFFHTIDFEKDLELIGKEFLIMKNELEEDIIEKLKYVLFYGNNDIIRVNISRFGADSIPFDQSEVSFIDTKIFGSVKVKMFLYYFEDVNENNQWEATKDLFIDEGIGGKRNLGKGYFEKITTDKFQFDNDNNHNIYLLLSNMIPQKGELKKILYYDTGIDDGYITFGSSTTYKKDSLFFLKEGSIVNSEIEGKIVSQKFKDNKIYRYGKALLLPLGGKNE